MRVAALALAAFALGGAAAAQTGLSIADATNTVEADQRSPMLTIKQRELFERSAFGKASLARIDAAMTALQAENRKIEAQLEAEERDLTVRRATTPPADFKGMAEAFDKKVKSIRSAQDEKSRQIGQGRDADQKRFFELAFPILAELMRSMGAVALIDQTSVVISLDRIDVTDIAVERLDEALGREGAIPDGTDDAAAPAAARP